MSNTMMHVIIRQSWSTPVDTVEGQQLGADILADPKPSRAEAELCAYELARKFRYYDYNEVDSYWWGRENEGHEVHRFLVRPATP